MDDREEEGQGKISHIQQFGIKYVNVVRWDEVYKAFDIKV